MKDFYSITPLAYFNASDEEIHLDFCSFIKFTEEQLQARFGDTSSSNFLTGTLNPTPWEMEQMANQYFLCFQTEKLHKDHFNYTTYALRLLYKFPAKTTKTFCREGATSGKFIYEIPQFHFKELPCLEDIPEDDIPIHLREDYRKVTKDQANIYEPMFRELREWDEQYGRFFWQEDTKDRFIKREEQLRKLFVDEQNNPDLRYLRFAVNWYWTTQDQDYFEERIVFSCLILELLCLKPNGSRDKGGELAKSINTLLPGSDREKRATRKLVKKYYHYRNQIMHGLACDEGTLDIKEQEIWQLLDICRKLILLMLEKGIEEGKGKQQILDEAFPGRGTACRVPTGFAP